MVRMTLPKVPGYEIFACLGGGALTSVYSARHVEGDASCALKLLRPDWADQPVAIKLLQREARACLMVQHPHLVQLLDVHVTRSPYYLVMEMLEGESLRRRLRRDYRLDLPAALWITRQVADALAALHRKGFIHGDVKPDNIRIAGAGNAVLLDLGFAHRSGENTTLLSAGYVLGTPNYLAPELCGSDPRDEKCTDLYSLGVTLFEMLTGQLPYPVGSERETLARHMSEPPADLDEHWPDAPKALVELTRALMSPAPEDRPNALEVVHDIVGLEIAALRRAA